MGTLFYGFDAAPIDMPDTLLAHVKVVVATKLRRGESFTMSWRHTDDQPRGRSTIWLQPAIPLRFVFDSAEIEMINPAALTELSHAANSSGGLVIALDVPLIRLDEPDLPLSARPAA